MTAQAKLYWDAVAILNARYTPGIESLLAKHDASGTVTITVNPEELALIKTLVSDHLGKLHQEWYDATHDDTETSAEDLAYELRQISLRDRQTCRILDKLNSTKREE